MHSTLSKVKKCAHCLFVVCGIVVGFYFIEEEEEEDNDGLGRRSIDRTNEKKHKYGVNCKGRITMMAQTAVHLSDYFTISPPFLSSRAEHIII